MSSSGDYQVAACAAGFSIGFGFLTTTRAIRQTKANRNPWKSAYIYMVWGEIIANLALGILCWLWLKDTVHNGPALLFFILFFYVFEVQFLMQIIINRISIISERKATAQRLKIGTAVVISIINIAVFCIFIPSHLTPPPSMVFVHINKYWDRASKILIMLVDAFLNAYFIYVVKARLVQQHGLRKYKPLVAYYTRLGVISVCMDLMLIGLMSLPNGIVFVQFHPVAYMVKLNIEISMADMIVKVARSNEQDMNFHSSSQGTPYPGTPNPQKSHHTFSDDRDERHGVLKHVTNTAFAGHTRGDEDLREDIHGIKRQTEVQVYVGDSDTEDRSIDLEQGKPTTRDFTRDRDGFAVNNRESHHSNESQIPMHDLGSPIGRAT
ncbi:hypothetical protein M436DRAFT_41332 [Aureobasidium namibiae CBS 147.97]|uniref:Uncharacterized protein n=1 Tax=Aureobasidium namibiae CBS 147.97 TaxID=1043004 RepID=A0A074WVM6_9PEZI